MSYILLLSFYRERHGGSAGKCDLPKIHIASKYCAVQNVRSGFLCYGKARTNFLDNPIVDQDFKPDVRDFEAHIFHHAASFRDLGAWYRKDE